MERIKRLPRSVHNPMRSSIILCDLPRVVEELVYNSVDASASKVFVSIGIKACYIKVDDDGCGITRDGMVILGERYATSKLGLLSDLETSTKSLGFRGEALSSLSDVSLVEIRSKARGKPTAYCKILKGSKCLFLGIDDKREGVGTTGYIDRTPIKWSTLLSSSSSPICSPPPRVLGDWASTNNGSSNLAATSHEQYCLRLINS